MMTFLDTYKKYLASSGNNVRDSMIKTFVNDANTLMKTNPSYFEVFINGSDTPIPSLIVDDSKNEDLKMISLAPNHPLKRGDYVEWDNHTWLVLITDNQGDIYKRGRMAQCSIENLKWVDESGKLHSYPCVYHYGAKANFGTFTDKVMTLPDGRRQVTVQKNDHTIKIKRGKRFMFGGNVFIVIDHDYIGEDGIVNLNLKDDQYNPSTDNLELGIADYYNHISNYRIKILNGDYLSIEKSQHLQLSVEVLNNGEPLENPQIQYSTDDEAIATIDENGLLTPISTGRVLVTAIFESTRDSIEVNITDSIVNNYTAEILGDNEIRQSLSKTYNVLFKNNGASINEIAQFSLTDTNNQPTNLATITSSDSDSCTIKAGEKEMGWVVLHVQSANGLIKTSKEIRIRSLL